MTVVGVALAALFDVGAAVLALLVVGVVDDVMAAALAVEVVLVVDVTVVLVTAAAAVVTWLRSSSRIKAEVVRQASPGIRDTTPTQNLMIIPAVKVLRAKLRSAVAHLVPGRCGLCVPRRHQVAHTATPQHAS